MTRRTRDSRRLRSIGGRVYPSEQALLASGGRSFTPTATALAYGGGAVTLLDLWPPLRNLPLRIERLEARPLELQVGPGFRRRTVEVRLSGAGAVGRGEDSGWSGASHAALCASAGPWAPSVTTLGELSLHLEELPGGDGPMAGVERGSDSWRSRRWALESAALDLALLRAGCSLPELLGIRPGPLRFVASRAPRTIEEVHRLLARCPGLRLKLDASPVWSEAFLRELGATGAVEIVDLHRVPEVPGQLELLERILEHLPGALIEDAPPGPEAEQRLREAGASCALDAGLLGPADLEGRSELVRSVSLKPARVGSLHAHLALAEACRSQGLETHGGGRFELGVGRLQLQTLAALLHPGAPNDLAPVQHHVGEDGTDLSSSPLEVAGLRPGFGRG